MNFILTMIIGSFTLMAATSEKYHPDGQHNTQEFSSILNISQEDFIKIVYTNSDGTDCNTGPSKDWNENNLLTSFPNNKPQHGFTKELADLIKEFREFNGGPSLCVRNIATALDSANPKYYDSLKQSVYKIMMGPEKLRRTGTMAFYKDLESQTTEESLEQQKALRPLQTAGLNMRPKGALATAHISNVIKAISLLSSPKEYAKFSQIMLEIPHHDSYHYLMSVEAFANIPAENWTDEFVDSFKKFDKLRLSDIPYILKSAKDFNYASNLVELYRARQEERKK